MKIYMTLLFSVLLLVPIWNSTISDCESTANPGSLKDCKGKETEENTETCCFLKSKDSSNNEDVECVDVVSDDVSTETKLKDVEAKIKSGTYWSDYNETYYNITEFTCDTSSSPYLVFGLLSLLCLLF